MAKKPPIFYRDNSPATFTEVNATQSRLGGLCEYKGRLYAIFYLLNWQNKYYLWLPTEIIANTITQLNKYAVFSKVTLQDKTNDLISIGIWGTQGRKIFICHNQ